MSGSRVLLLASLLLVGMFAAVPLFAQKITGDISGTVLDSTGAAVKDAKVTASNVATGETRSASTSDTGFYRILELPPGSYKVDVKVPGFKSETRTAEVAISSVTQSDFHLLPGQVSEMVEVQEVAPLVETTEDRLSTLFVGREVADLPNNGRDFNNLLDGVPGVQRSPGGGFQSLNINGQRATSNNFAVDGIPNNDRYYGESSLGQAAISGTAAALIPLEGISEFNVQSNPGVEYGVRGGSVINIGLKSGTNAIHGSAFWDRHTNAFDAQNPFAPGVPFRLNQFGASGGFPIKKDKAFAYMSYQGFRLKDAFPSQITLPTPSQIFDATQCVQTGVNPNTSGTIGPDGVTPWTTCLNKGPGPGSDQIFGTSDDGTVSSIGSKLLSFVPTSPTGTASISAANSLSVNNFHVKFDYIFNDKHRLSVKYLFGDSLQSQPAAPGVPQSIGPLATSPAMWNSVAPTRAQLAGINYTWTIGANKVLESRFGYQRFSQRIGVNNNIDPIALGINTGPLGSSPQDKENLGVPTVYYLGYFGPTGYPMIGGIQGYPIITRPDASFDWQEHFTMIKGSHTIKVGGQYQDAFTKSRRDRARTALTFYSSGFSSCASSGACDPTFSGVTQNNPVAALNELLLGLTEDAGRSFAGPNGVGDTNRHIFQKSLGLYVQDSWKIKPNFTLEVGVRWDVSGALGEKNNLGANYLPNDPKADSNGFVSLAKEPLYGVDKNNFGPRVGFAWDLRKNGKSVLRSGFSLNYDLPNFGTIAAPQTYLPGAQWSGTRAGFFTQVADGVVSIDVTSTPSDNLSVFNSGTQANGLCSIFICMSPSQPLYGSNPTAATSTPSVVQLVRNFKTPMNYAYNLTLEQALTNKTSFSLAYVGTAGRDLANWRDLNACHVSIFPCGDPNNPQPLGSVYKHVMQLNNDGYSNYNSLQVAYKVRDLRGLTGQLNYVWSKALDTGSANRGGTFLSNNQNPYNIRGGYAPSDFDTPWNVNFSLVYDVPKMHSLPKLVGEGWSLNSLFRAQAGRPFTIFSTVGIDPTSTDPTCAPNCTRSDPTGQGLKNNFVDFSGIPLHYDFHTRGQFFNTDAFKLPAIGTVGDAGRNSLRQPGIAQLDMGIFKNFKLTERFAVKFKWEVFNVLNHAMFATGIPSKLGGNSTGKYFATPDVGLGFNPILGTGAQRNMQFGLAVDF